MFLTCWYFWTVPATAVLVAGGGAAVVGGGAGAAVVLPGLEGGAGPAPPP